jgi:hypothetical protein
MGQEGGVKRRSRMGQGRRQKGGQEGVKKGGQNKKGSRRGSRGEKRTPGLHDHVD